MSFKQANKFLREGKLDEALEIYKKTPKDSPLYKQAQFNIRLIQNKQIGKDNTHQSNTNTDQHNSVALVEHNQPLVSVVMPVFNVAPYLDASILSVLDQTYSNIELIIVDDASTDNGMNIIRMHEQLDNRIKVVQLDFNTLGGAGIPSNIGISEAKGVYIAFADSDDILHKDAIRNLVEAAEENDAEIVIADFCNFNNETRVFERAYDKRRWSGLPLGTVFHPKEYPTVFSISPVPWRKLYKREFLEKQYPNFIFNEKINKMQSASSILTLLVDGVVSVSSSVALQALFWNKIVIAAGNSHINGISDFHIDNIQTNDRFYCLSKGKNSDDKLIHLLKYYYVPDSILTNTHTAEIFYKNLFTKSIGGFVISEEKDIAYNYSVSKLPETKEVIEFNQGIYANYLSSDIIDKVASNEVISFDIFDTLIIRPFSFPHHVFTYMNDEVAEITGDYNEKFSIYRRSLHQEVKKITALEEVRLDEIYDYIAEVKGWSVKVKNEVKALELNYELHFCTEKKYGKAVFELAKKLNKKIILISDMYLSKQHIEAILSKNGYSEYDGLYVSSEYRKDKHTSNLFKVVLSEHEVHPSKILHIGDNKISDVDIPNKLGLNTLFIDKNITHFVRNASNQALWKYDIHRTSFSYKEAEYHLPALLGLYANKLSDNEGLIKRHSLFNGSSYNIGYYGLGLLVFQFNKWLIDQAKENDIKRLYFLSRDAYIFYQVFCRMAEQFPEYTNGIDFKYIYVSRKTIITANIFTEQDILDLISRPYRFKLTLKAFLKNRFNLYEDFMQEIASMDLKKFGFDDLDTEFLLKDNFEELKNFAKLFNSISSYHLRLFRREFAQTYQVSHVQSCLDVYRQPHLIPLVLDVTSLFWCHAPMPAASSG